jgi:hypothetical protein
VRATETPAPGRPAWLAEGETVLWRERRTPPIMQAALGLAALLALAGIGVAGLVVTPLLFAAAIAVALYGRRLAAAHYLEDQLLTDRRALVVPRIGTAYGLPLDAIENVEMRGTKAVFTGSGGKQFRFSFVTRHRTLRRALELGAPHISLEQRWDPNCAG